MPILDVDPSGVPENIKKWMAAEAQAARGVPWLDYVPELDALTSARIRLAQLTPPPPETAPHVTDWEVPEIMRDVLRGARDIYEISTDGKAPRS